MNREILVCCDTGCLVNGAQAVLDELRHDAIGMDVSIKPYVKNVGCNGLCEKGPIVTILPDNITYYKVKPSDAADILESLGNKAVDRLLYKDKEGTPVLSRKDHPFYATQHKIALRNTGIIDPGSIEDFLSRGGYEGLKKALTMMLWIFWPSFTSALVAPTQIVLTVINTVFALCAATLATFLFSKMIRGKIEIEDIANAALAGGVAIGSTCNVATPGMSLLIGLCAGALSTVGYAIIAPKVEKLIRGTDTCGVHNLHGMPGVLGGLSAIVITHNPGVQIAGILATVVIAFACGKVAGVVVSLMGKKEKPYNDEDEFLVEEVQ